MPAPYSAGSIFVSVLPSFKDNQNDIAREYRRRGEEASKDFAEAFDKQIAKDLPKAMEKSARSTRQAQSAAGEKAGEEYSSAFRKVLANGISHAQRELERLEVKVPMDVDRDKFLNTLNALKRDVNLTSADLRIGGDATGALAEVDRVIGALRRLQAMSTDAEFRTGLGAAAGPIEDAAKRVRQQAALQPEQPQSVQPQLGAFQSTARSRVQSALQALPPVSVDADVSPAMRKIIEFRADAFRLLDDLDADVNLDADDTLARARALMTLLEGVIETADPTVEIDASFNAAGALAQIKTWVEAVDPIEVEVEADLGFFRARVAQQLKAASAALPEVNIAIEADEGMRTLGRLRTELAVLGRHVEIGLDLEDARKTVVQLRKELGELRKTDPNIEVDVDAARAIIQLEAIEKAADDADRELHKSARGADDGANSFRAFSARVLAVATIGPLAIPVIGALGAGLGALGPLALAGAAGLGVFALGVMGVSDAVGAMQDVQDNAKKDAEAYADGVRNASRSLSSAERGVAEARRSAADSAVQSRQRIADAARRVEDAEKDLEDAQRDAQQAQTALTQAREDYADRMEDLQLRARGGALAERRAIMQLAEAQIAYANAVADPGATRTEREQLLLDLEEQKLRVDEVKLSNQRLGEEQRDAAKKGVEGSDEVVSAQDRVRQANDRVADAQNSVAEAVADVAQAQADSQRAAADSARDISEAQLRLADAQADYADAVSATSSSQDALAQSMAKLSPAGREFAQYLFSLKPYFAELRNAAQGGLLPGLQEWMQRTISAYGPQFISIVGGMSEALGNMFRGFATALEGPEWAAFFDMLESKGPVFLGQIGQVLANLGTGVASLLVAFGPAAEKFGDGLVRASESFANWAAGLRNTEGFQTFIDWWDRVGPKVLAFFWALGEAVVNLAIALAPYAEDLMTLVTAALSFIGEMDPQVLGAIAVAVLGVAAAFQLLVGLRALIAGFGTVMGLASGAMNVFNGTAIGTQAILLGWAGVAAIAIASLAIIGVALYLLWQNSETFRDIVTGAWRAIMAGVEVVVDWFQTYVQPVLSAVLTALGDFFTWLWEDIIEPIFGVWQVAWGVLWGFLVTLWETVGQPLFALIGEVIKEIWQVIGPIFELIGIAFGALWTVVVAFWDTIGKPVFDAFIAIVTWLWEKVIDPILGWIAEGFGWLFGIIKSAWDNVGKPIFDFFQATVEGLVGIFQGSFDGIKGIWEALLDVLMAPIVFVVETVLNKGLIAGINWIAGIFTDDKTWIDPIPTDWIPGRAEGGPIPGTSPHKRADNVLIRATAGEFMHEVDTVDYYGEGMMDALNRRLIPREALYAGLQGRAYGGLIDPMWNVVSKRFPNARLTSGYRPGDPGYHGMKKAIDIGGSRPYPDPNGIREMLSINKWIAANYGTGIAELIHTQPGAINLHNGVGHTYNADTRRQHLNHVHWAMDSLAGMFAGVFTSGDAMAEQSIWGKMADFVSSPLGFLKNIVTNWAGDLGDSQIGEMLLNIPMNLAESVVDVLKSLIGLGEGTGPQVGDTMVLDGIGSVQDQVRLVANGYGWGSGTQWEALSRLIQKESGWNPRAANPNSSARGLFQKMTSAHGPLENTASGQAEWGLNYIADRYGDPIRALRFHERNNWYSHGGLITGGLTPTLHDDGGVIDPGWNLIYNATRKPEASLNPQQLENIETIADNGGSPLLGAYHQHMIAADPAEAHDQLMHDLAVVSLGGRYVDTGE